MVLFKAVKTVFNVCTYKCKILTFFILHELSDLTYLLSALHLIPPFLFTDFSGDLSNLYTQKKKTVGKSELQNISLKCCRLCYKNH